MCNGPAPRPPSPSGPQNPHFCQIESTQYGRPAARMGPGTALPAGSGVPRPPLAQCPAGTAGSGCGGCRKGMYSRGGDNRCRLCPPCTTNLGVNSTSIAACVGELAAVCRGSRACVPCAHACITYGQTARASACTHRHCIACARGRAACRVALAPPLVLVIAEGSCLTHATIVGANQQHAGALAPQPPARWMAGPGVTRRAPTHVLSAWPPTPGPASAVHLAPAGLLRSLPTNASAVDYRRH